MDWTDGLTFFVLKTTFVLSSETSPHSPVGLVVMHFKSGHKSLCVDLKDITTAILYTMIVVRPCFTLCLVCSMG